METHTTSVYLIYKAFLGSTCRQNVSRHQEIAPAMNYMLYDYYWLCKLRYALNIRRHAHSTCNWPLRTFYVTISTRWGMQIFSEFPVTTPKVSPSPDDLYTSVCQFCWTSKNITSCGQLCYIKCILVQNIGEFSMCKNSNHLTSATSKPFFHCM